LIGPLKTPIESLPLRSEPALYPRDIGFWNDRGLDS